MYEWSWVFLYDMPFYNCNRSGFKRLSYEGFYTMVLEKDGEIISVALLRFGLKKFLLVVSFPLVVPVYNVAIFILSLVYSEFSQCQWTKCLALFCYILRLFRTQLTTRYFIFTALYTNLWLRWASLVV